MHRKKFPEYAPTLLKNAEKNLKQKQLRMSPEARKLLYELVANQIQNEEAFKEHKELQFDKYVEKSVKQYIKKVQRGIPKNKKTTSDRGKKNLASNNLRKFLEMVAFVHEMEAKVVDDREELNVVAPETIINVMKKTCNIFPICK